MSARSISPDLVAALKRLRLGGLLPTLAERFSLAEKEDTPYEDLLLMLLVDEISRRDSTASIRRADVAGLDPDMVLERWDKSAKVTYDRRVMNELVSLRFVEDHRNVVVLGPVGVGMTFLANALGHLCCRAGFNVRLLRADALLRLLKQSRMDNSRETVMTELATVDVLIIDDFALEPMSREESRHRAGGGNLRGDGPADQRELPRPSVLVEDRDHQRVPRQCGERQRNPRRLHLRHGTPRGGTLSSAGAAAATDRASLHAARLRCVQ